METRGRTIKDKTLHHYGDFPDFSRTHYYARMLEISRDIKREIREQGALKKSDRQLTEW